MRPRIVEYLQSFFGSRDIDYFVPTGTTILTLAIALVLWIMLVRGKTSGLPPKHIVGASASGVLLGLAGARAFHLVQHLSRTLDNPELILHLSGGTTSWGGYLVGTSAFCAYLRLARQPVLNYLDLLASGLGLGPAIARWGCFMNGCCFGKPTFVPWAMQFPHNSFAYQSHVKEGLIESTASLSHPVHPVQLYGSLAGALLFIGMSLFWRFNRRRAGLTFAAYWVVYCSVRVFTEFIRGDVPRSSTLHLTMSQHMCILVIMMAGFMFYRRLVATRQTG